MNNTELIKLAKSAILRRLDANERLHGDVGAAVLGKNGKIYLGVCIDTPSWGLCAERSALAAMITDGEYNFSKIVAVWKCEKTNKHAVLPPCGHCIQFMRDIDENNLTSTITLGLKSQTTLKEMIPHHKWPCFIEDIDETL